MILYVLSLHILTIFPSAEVGYVSEWPPRPQGIDWQWVVPRKTLDIYFEPFLDDSYEILIKVCMYRDIV